MKNIQKELLKLPSKKVMKTDGSLMIRNNGVWYNLVYSSNFLLFNESDLIVITFEVLNKDGEMTPHTFSFEFTNLKNLEKGLRLVSGDTMQKIYLLNWNDDPWNENTPHKKIISHDNETEFYLKIRSYNTNDIPVRNVVISIYQFNSYDK